jgi:hypothetical protein
LKQIGCEQCGQVLSMNETFTVLGRSLCEPCTEEELARHAEGEVPKEAVRRQTDPTVCAACEADNGDVELRTLAGKPVCENCEKSYRNRPYPRWLKIAFVTLLVLAVASFARNWRFLSAYVEGRQAERAFSEGNIDRAADLMSEAAGEVPESKEMQGMAGFFNGIRLLGQERSAEAVAALRVAKDNLGSAPVLEQLLAQAEGGAAFDSKDYDTFLTKMQVLERTAPNNAMVIASVASAYACKYAVTGKEEFRKAAEQHLERAARFADKTDPSFPEYETRIRHRLRTREIISRKEYYRRFPPGPDSTSKP